MTSYHYDKQIGRIRLRAAGVKGMPSTSSEATLSIRKGWNESCPFKDNELSIEELCDLRYLIDRAIDAATP